MKKPIQNFFTLEVLSGLDAKSTKHKSFVVEVPYFICCLFGRSILSRYRAPLSLEAYESALQKVFEINEDN